MVHSVEHLSFTIIVKKHQPTSQQQQVYFTPTGDPALSWRWGSVHGISWAVQWVRMLLIDGIEVDKARCLR